MGELKERKCFEELGFTDDFMFGKVMEDPKLCQEVLECLLQQPVGELTTIQTQREFKYTAEGKSIKLDVYNEDSNGVVYDAEMQNLNKKGVEFHQLPKRCRFYQGALDNDYLDSGNPYRSLPDCKIIFICTFDPFGQGLPQYTFTERCREAPKLELNDGTAKYFFNCCYMGEGLAKETKELYEYIRSGDVSTPLTKRIEEAVEKGRKNKMLRSEYLKERQYVMNIQEEARENDIIDMLGRGKTVEEIVDFCGYPYEQVKKVEENLLVIPK